jgi:hypothetical protein
MTDYRLEVWGSIPGRGKIFLFFPISRLTPGPNQNPIQWVPVQIFPKAKQPGREAGYSPPSYAEFKYGETIHPLHRTSSWRVA